MIVRFTVENYMSFKDETTLDFVSNSHIPFDPEHKYKFGRLSVLKNIGVFGANASGKTTILQALKTLHELVLGSKPALSAAFKGCEAKPTRFNLLIENDKRFFEYSLAVLFYQTGEVAKIINEEIYESWLSGKHAAIFINGAASDKAELALDPEIIEGYKRTRGLPFLAYASSEKWKYKSGRAIDAIRKFSEFFTKKIRFLFSDLQKQPLLSKAEYRQLETMLREYDLGIERVSISKTGEPAFYHTSIAEPFSFSEESEGVKNIVRLLCRLYENDEDDCTCIIDNIDYGLHPQIVRHIITDYQRRNRENKNQLLFTTHLPALMDEVLKRDEIYFTEKSNQGASFLKSLQEYKTRNRRESVAEKYMEGRYGALPNLPIHI